MNIIAWVIFGLIAGAIANMIDPRPAQGGIWGAIVLGILGAVVGGFIANLIFGLSVSGFNFESFIIAVLGSLLLLMLQRSFRGGLSR
jgi:uncharacterized membrane protein YeaQ/YmgE (transglycosylase-associated protein family)